MKICITGEEWIFLFLRCMWHHKKIPQIRNTKLMAEKVKDVHYAHYEKNSMDT